MCRWHRRASATPWRMDEAFDSIGLRFAATGGALRRLRGLPALKGHLRAPAITRRLVSCYWDTSDLRIHGAQDALQLVRVDDGPWIERHSSRSPSGGFRTVRECSRADGRPGPDAAGLRDLEPQQLRPVFGARVTRTIHTLRLSDGTVVRLAIDRGESWLATAPRRREPVLEFELLLVRGRREQVYELATAIVDGVAHVRLLFGSEADRGYESLVGAPPVVRRVRARGATALARLVHDGVSECLTQIGHNLEGARRGANEEALHQLRVGVRRLRAICAIGRKAGLSPLPGSVREQIRWLWALLGEARDWDVFVGETWPAVERRAGPDAASEGFGEIASDLRDASRRRLRRALTGRCVQSLMLALLRFGERQDAESARVGGAREAAKLAGRLLARRAHKVLRSGARAARLAGDEQHALRIDVKKLRYLAELFADLSDHAASAAYLKRLAALQTVLGRLNDLAVAGRLVLRVEADPRAPQSGVASDAWRRYAAVQDSRLRRQLRKRWREFRKSPPFWD